MGPDRRQQIARSFGAAEGYDAHSQVQRHVAATLASRIAALLLDAAPEVLEIGCGTGHLSEALALALPEARALFSDLSPGMVSRCRARLGATPVRAFAALDGEALPFAPGAFDLVTSAMAFQWFNDLGGALRKLVTIVLPRGYLAFATLGVDTFREWKEAHQTAGFDSGIMPCPRIDELEAMLASIPDTTFEIDEERVVTTHPHARAFLLELKAIGAAVPRAQHRPLSCSQLREVMAALEARTPGRVEITYHVLYATLRRKEGP